MWSGQTSLSRSEEAWWLREVSSWGLDTTFSLRSELTVAVSDGILAVVLRVMTSVGPPVQVVVGVTSWDRVAAALVGAAVAVAAVAAAVVGAAVSAAWGGVVEASRPWVSAKASGL